MAAIAAERTLLEAKLRNGSPDGRLAGGIASLAPDAGPQARRREAVKAIEPRAAQCSCGG
jgi:hypothetical protein